MLGDNRLDWFDEEQEEEDDKGKQEAALEAVRDPQRLALKALAAAAINSRAIALASALALVLTTLLVLYYSAS